MDFLKKSSLLAMLFMGLCSCAKLDYLYEQSVGQISIFAKARDNKEVISNVRIPKENRDKVKRIQELKKYFYLYWGKKETPIYSQTTMLKQKAVTYLVIASPFEEIKALENCFPLMGCFPYLGFFNLNSAKKFADDKEKDGFVTWVRPVYAYSTLGYFTDTILSSFFHYNDIDLTEMIFHELFHTIFFVKNEVELNENLANYFSVAMMDEYFKSEGKSDYITIHQKEDFEEKELKKLIVVLANELQELYKNLLPKNREEAQKILNEFLENRFKVEILKKCQSLNIENKQCFPIERKWNNASFAAFLTYENKSDELEKLQKKLKLNIK